MSDKNHDIQSAIRAAAENFLKERRVNMVIGYGVNSLGETSPEFVRDMEHARELVWNNSCFHNLTTYLSREHIKKYLPVGIVVKGCDMKAVNMLLKENESTYIPAGMIHQLANHTDEVLEVIEVQTGSYLEEDDIERLDDPYNRSGISG